MRISNQQTPPTESTSRKKPIILWSLFVCAMLLVGVGSAAVLANRDTSQADGGENPLDGVISAEEAPITDQTEIEAAVEHALAEQSAIHQETIAELEGKLRQFDQDDAEGYQEQIADLQKDIDALREANAELSEANQRLSETNAELTERTTVAEIQEAYEKQIEQLESDNQKLEELLQGIQRQLEGGQ